MANVDNVKSIPFDPGTCTLGDQVSDEEQAAFDACVRANATIHDFWRNASQADWMLDVLRDKFERIDVVPERGLREFALTCVGTLQLPDSPGTERLLDVVRRRTTGDATLEELRCVQELIRGGVTAGGIQGLPRLALGAAAMLAAWHTADADPYQAAFWTAEFTAKCQGFAAVRRAFRTCGERVDTLPGWNESWRVAAFNAAHPEIYRTAAIDERRRQAEALRSILPDPFAMGTPVRADVYMGPPQNGKMAVFCTACGARIPSVSLGVIFDVRGMHCGRCHTPLGGNIQ